MMKYNLSIDTIYNKDCLEGLITLPDNSIDLIVTDPPYLIENTKAGGKSDLAKSIQHMNNQIRDNGLTQGFDMKILNELVRVMKKINIYIWCNHKQIPAYLDFFVKTIGCSFDILIWHKTNPMPLYNNKYMTDKEYCLYFRQGGYCNPASYKDAKTVWEQPINAKDKKIWGHPTIKPLNIIETLIRNSSKEGDIILDPFIGSGTTAIAAINTGRHYIGYENNPDYHQICINRIQKSLSEQNRNVA